MKTKLNIGIKQLLMLVVLVIATLGMNAQDLEDFKEASESEGVESIPYPDLRREARGYSDDRNDAGGQTRRFDKYDNYVKKKEKLLNQRAKLIERIKDLKEEEEEIKRRSDQAVDSPLEIDINEAQEEKVEVNEKLKKLNNEIKNAQEAYEELYTARKKLREAFEEAIDKLERTERYPEEVLGRDPGDDKIKELEGYIDDISRHINSEFRNHREQEDGAEGTAERLGQLASREQ